MLFLLLYFLHLSDIHHTVSSIMTITNRCLGCISLKTFVLNFITWLPRFRCALSKFKLKIFVIRPFSIDPIIITRWWVRTDALHTISNCLDTVLRLQCCSTRSALYSNLLVHIYLPLWMLFSFLSWNSKFWSLI